MQSDPRPAGRLTAVVVGLALVLAVSSAWLFGFRAAGVLLGVVLAAAAAARLTVPPARVPVLVVRSRAVDVGMLLVLAVAAVVLASTAPSGAGD